MTTTAIIESVQLDNTIGHTSDDHEDTNSQCTSNLVNEYSQVLKFPDIDSSVGPNDKAVCLSCATLQIEMPTSSCPSCGGSDLYVTPKKGIWQEDEAVREKNSITGDAIEPLIIKTIEASNSDNATSKFLSVVGQCYGETTEENISAYVDSRIEKLHFHGISTVQQIVTEIFAIQRIYFERVYSIDHHNKTIIFHPVRITFLERQIMLEAATCWLKHEYKLSKEWITLHRRTKGFINKTWKMA